MAYHAQVLPVRDYYSLVAAEEATLPLTVLTLTKRLLTSKCWASFIMVVSLMDIIYELLVSY